MSLKFPSLQALIKDTYTTSQVINTQWQKQEERKKGSTESFSFAVCWFFFLQLRKFSFTSQPAQFKHFLKDRCEKPTIPEIFCSRFTVIISRLPQGGNKASSMLALNHLPKDVDSCSIAIFFSQLHIILIFIILHILKSAIPQS